MTTTLQSGVARPSLDWPRSKAPNKPRRTVSKPEPHLDLCDLVGAEKEGLRRFIHMSRLEGPLPPKSYDLCKHFYQKFQPLSPYSSHLCKHFYQTFQQMCAPIVPFLPDV